MPCTRNASLTPFSPSGHPDPVASPCFGRTWCFNDGGIHDCPLLEDQPQVGQGFYYKSKEFFMNVVVDEQIAESDDGVAVRNLIAGFHTAEIRKSPAVDDLISSAFVGQVVEILQKMNPQHQLQGVGHISALSLIVARSDQLLLLSPHGMIRSICSRNSLLCVLTSFSSSLKNDRFICLFIPLFYHFFVNFSTASSSCGVALIFPGNSYQQLNLTTVLLIFSFKIVRDSI